MTRAPRFLPLSGQDEGYLRRESDSQPMHFVVAMLVAPADDGSALGLQDVRDHVAARLPGVPHLRRRTARAPGGVGPRVWLDDPDVDLQHHIRALDRRHDEADADSVLAALAVERLDTTRPLWQMRVSSPKPDGQVLVTLAVHHAAMDGGLLISVLKALLGTDQPPPEPGLGAPPSRGRLLAFAVRLALRDRWRSLTRRGPRPPAPSAPVAPEASSLAGPVGPRRAVQSATFRLDDLRRLRATTGATVNDAYVAAVAGGVRALLLSRGASCDSPLLALVPRDVRASDEATATGNRTWTMHVPLRVDLPDPLPRLTATCAAMQQAKLSLRSSGNAGFRFDIAVSNVPLGGPFALAGRAVRSCTATAPLQGENRVLTLALSHGDAFTVTWTVDPDAVPDLPVAAAGTSRALQDLLRLSL